jgi:hypothetical protein
MKVHSFPVLDTGIGIEAGYASDRDLLEAAAKERAEKSPADRAILDECDRLIDRAFLFGDR